MFVSEDLLMKRTYIALLALLFVSTPSLCFGQCRSCMPATLFSWTGDREMLGELSSITTDRPDFTEASSTVGLGVTQLEIGYTYTEADDSRVHSWGEPLLRYGVFANWFELRLAAAPLSDFGTLSNSGFADLYLGAKIGLMQQQGIFPELAIIPQMTVPTGGSDFTADRVLPGANLLYGWELTDQLSFAGSTQYNRAVDDSLDAYDEWAQSLTVATSITDEIGAYFEWFAFFPRAISTVQDEHYINGGFTYLASDDVQWDIRAGKGLSDTGDDFFVGAGISLRFK